MKPALPVLPDRIRTIPASFSWIDRRIVTDNFLVYLSKDEIALYFFLVTVSNRLGVSFYGPARICRLTGLTRSELDDATRGLIELELLAFRFPFYQVLALPQRPVRTPSAVERLASRGECR